MNESWKKNTFLFLLSQTVSLFGSSLVQCAIMWYITINTKSGITLGIAVVCGFLPTFILSPFAGVLADRYSRKMLIIVSDSLIALSTLVLAVLFHIGYGSVVLLLIFTALRAIGMGFHTPSVNAFIPQIVPKDNLEKVNGISGSIQGMIMLLSPILGGVILTVSSIKYIFFIDIITAIIAVFILLFFLKVPVHEKAQDSKRTHYIKDLKEGIGYIRKSSYLGKFFIFYGLIYFLATPTIFLTPLEVTRSFGGDLWRLSALEATFTFGAILGSIFIMSKGGFKNRIYTIALSSFVIGITAVILGIIPRTLPVFWLLIAVWTITGIAIPLYNTPVTVMLQEKVEGDFHGRVFGILNMISSSVMPLGMLVFGPLADSVRIQWLLIGSGVLIIIQSFFFLSSKELVAAGKPKDTLNEAS